MNAIIRIVGNGAVGNCVVACIIKMNAIIKIVWNGAVGNCVFTCIIKMNTVIILWDDTISNCISDWIEKLYAFRIIWDVAVGKCVVACIIKMNAIFRNINPPIIISLNDLRDQSLRPPKTQSRRHTPMSLQPKPAFGETPSSRWPKFLSLRTTALCQARLTYGLEY